jgi:hypothetical protein
MSKLMEVYHDAIPMPLRDSVTTVLPLSQPPERLMQ